MYWVEHLENMDYMRSSVNLRAYGQRDPLVEYKKEGLRLFREMQENIKMQVFSLIERIGEDVFAKEAARVGEIQESALKITAGGNSTSGIIKKQEVGRNDPCPCGSGKKYKRCHGA